MKGLYRVILITIMQITNLVRHESRLPLGVGVMHRLAVRELALVLIGDDLMSTARDSQRAAFPLHAAPGTSFPVASHYSKYWKALGGHLGVD